MADWTNVLDSAQDPDAPITSEWGYAMRDNPIAIAEGASGAPRISAYARLNDTIGFYSAASGNIIDLSRVKVIRLNFFFDSATTVTFAFSNNNGSTWGAGQTITVRDVVEVDLDTGDAAASGAISGFTVPSNCNAVRLTGGTGWTAHAQVASGRITWV